MGKSKFYRLWLAKTLIKPLIFVDLVAGLLAIIFGAVIYYHPEWGGTMNFLLWTIPLAVFTASIVVGFLLAPYFIYKDQEKEGNVIKSKLKQIKDARPNIVFTEAENIRTPIRDLKTGVIYGEPTFTQVKFANDPLTSLQAIDAKNVVGNIDIYRQDGQHLFNMIGRWAETKEEVTGGLPAEMEQITIPANGRPCPLDIALKYKKDENAYGHNNKSRRVAPSDWRNEQWRLVVGNYFVRVQLRGSNIGDKVLWFELTNKGAGSDIELNVAVNPPSIPDKEGSRNG